MENLPDLNSSAIISRMVIASKSKSEAELSRRLGISSQQLCNMKRNNTIPFMAAAVISRETGVSLDYLVFGPAPAEPLKPLIMQERRGVYFTGD